MLGGFGDAIKDFQRAEQYLTEVDPPSRDVTLQLAATKNNLALLWASHGDPQLRAKNTLTQS